MCLQISRQIKPIGENSFKSLFSTGLKVLTVVETFTYKTVCLTLSLYCCCSVCTNTIKYS